MTCYKRNIIHIVTFLKSFTENRNLQLLFWEEVLYLLQNMIQFKCCVAQAIVFLIKDPACSLLLLQLHDLYMIRLHVCFYMYLPNILMNIFFPMNKSCLFSNASQEHWVWKAKYFPESYVFGKMCCLGPSFAKRLPRPCEVWSQWACYMRIVQDNSTVYVKTT